MQVRGVRNSFEETRIADGEGRLLCQRIQKNQVTFCESFVGTPPRPQHTQPFLLERQSHYGQGQYTLGLQEEAYGGGLRRWCKKD
jgi:hypothetical protein